MPLRRTKTYQVVTAAAAPSIRPVPENPRRVAIFVQNTGVNPGVMRFGGATAGNGSDIAFATLATLILNQADTCPLESLNFSSVLATTWCVMETVDGEAQGNG